MRIFKVKWFAKFARRERIPDSSLVDAIDAARQGLVDADLGGHLIKQRVARTGQGKSGGYRTIIAFKTADRAIFMYAFAKSDRANLTNDELDHYKTAAKHLLALSSADLDRLAAERTLIEVDLDE